MVYRMYNALIEQFKLAQTLASDAYRAVASAEMSAFPWLEDYERATRSRHDYKAERELSKFCVDLSEVVVRVARRELTPPGTRIEIDRASELEAAGIDIGEGLREGRTPDLDAFWSHLKRKFSGDAGAEIAYKQAAKGIIDGLWLKPGTELKRTSSGIVIDVPTGSEASFSSAGWRRVSYYAQTRASALISGLSTFATRAGYASLAAELQRSRIVSDEYRSRDKLPFSGLEIVLFNDKWQFKFSHAVGDSLSLFVSEFGADYLASR